MSVNELDDDQPDLEDVIERLRARNAELVEQLALAKSAHGANARVRRRIRRVENFDGEKAFIETARKLEAMKERNAELVAALEEIGKQRTSDELSTDENEYADYQFAYDAAVACARAALAAAGQGEPK